MFCFHNWFGNYKTKVTESEHHFQNLWIHAFWWLKIDGLVKYWYNLWLTNRFISPLYILPLSYGMFSPFSGFLKVEALRMKTFGDTFSPDVFWVVKSTNPETCGTLFYFTLYHGVSITVHIKTLPFHWRLNHFFLHGHETNKLFFSRHLFISPTFPGMSY